MTTNSPPLSPVARRLVAAFVVCILAAPLTTCRLDRLIKPSVVDRLAVSLDSVRQTGNSGSTKPREDTVRVTHADDATLPLAWSATKTAAWVTLKTTAGVAPDDVVVSLHAGTLAEGLYQDTIVFTSAQASGDPIRVPVTFDILPPAAELVVSPTVRDTSAFVGSALPDTFTLRIKNPGALPLNWTAALDTGWITLSDSSGVVSPGDTTSTTVLVTLRPESLSAGTHRATITLTDPAADGSPATVPVTFTINPCAVPLVTPDAGLAGTLTRSDCGAPHVPGSHAKLYRVQPATGDTLSFRLTAAFDAVVVLTNAAGDSVAVDDDCVEASTVCIINFPVLAGGRHIVEVTTATPGDTGTFALSVVRERAPSSPQSPGQFRKNGTTAIGSGAVTPEDTVVFRATINDPNLGDSVRLEIEVAPVGSAFGNSPHQSAFVAAAGGPGGTNVTVRVPATGLSENGGHHWQARTCDKTGRCSTWVSFGANPETAADFFINAVPEMPNPPSGLGQFDGGAPIALGGGTGGGGLGSTQETVTFRAVVTDPDPGDSVSIEVEVKETDTAFNETNLRRGSLVASNSTASRDVEVTAPGGLFPPPPNRYHWRARACDQTNRCGAWVSFGNNSETQADFTAP